MKRTRVLVVDDSAVIRRMLTDILAAEPDLEVVGTASSGSIALAKVASLAPDVITLDVEMPGMDGLATLTELRRRHPKVAVIMFSGLTAAAAAVTLEALARGATHYVTKPSHTGSREAACEHVRSQLVPTLRGITGPRGTTGPRAMTRPPIVAPARRERGPRPPVELVAIGVSTGGPNALAAICAGLEPPGVPIVVAQHMPPVFTAMLAGRLSASGVVPFREAEHGMRAQPGVGYIAPGDHHLRVERDAEGLWLSLGRGPAENSCRPAVDVLFRSAAETCRDRTLAIVMTGMGQDGLRGSEQLVQAGAVVLAQDEASSVVWGMPGYVVRAGLAERVVPLGAIADEINRRVRATQGVKRVG